MTTSLQVASAGAVDLPVYRCGHGYAAVPDPACPQAPPIDVDDPRTASDRRQGDEVTRRQKALAAWLEAQRHAREAAVPVARPPARAASSSAAGASSPRHHRHRRAAEAASAASRPFRASVPKDPR